MQNPNKGTLKSKICLCPKGVIVLSKKCNLFFSQWLFFTYVHPLDETHLTVVRGLYPGYTQCVGVTQLSSSRTKEGLIQSGRIQIKVASLSLVSFHHMSALALRWLISYISIYHLFAGAYIISFSFRLWMGWNFVFGSEIW